jgi:ABC-type spermidine/putrescine transport system permease subunit I
LAVEKRVRFRSWWLPWALIAPQMAIVLVFFFWPAAQALYYSVQQQDAFGTSVTFVGLDNFRALLADESYLASFQTTAVFSVLVASTGLTLSLMLAVMADRVVKGAGFYKTLLIWPYAVAPAIAGVLWLFMFAPSIGVVTYALNAMGIEWNHLLDGQDAMTLIVLAAVWKQVSYNFLFFLAGLQSIPRSLIEAALLDGAVPAAVAHHVLPARDQHRLRVLRHLRDRRRGHLGRARQGHRDPGLQGLLRRLQGARPRRQRSAVGGADGDRHRADGDPVPLRRAQGELLTWSRTAPQPPCCRTSCWCSAC